MTQRPNSVPDIRPLTISDLRKSLALGVRDFAATPLIDVFFAVFFVVTGLIMAWVTYETETTFWLVLAVLGFPLIGGLAALGFYETSRRRMQGEPLRLWEIAGVAWSHRSGQLPWLAIIIVVVFLFWFFLGHMIFALFLGLAPMTNISSSLDVFLTTDGLTMLVFGTVVGAVFATLVFSISVLGMPMLLDRDVDFISAMLRSISAVVANPMIYLVWGLFIGIVTIASMVPMFLGLFITMPILGHATWHLYKQVSDVTPPAATPGSSNGSVPTDG